MFKKVRRALLPLKAAIRAPSAWSAARRRRLSVKPFYFSICAIFKDEAQHLHEWIAFHRGVGVEHFFLYNNNSTDHFRAVLGRFDCVTLTEWPLRQSPQRAAYEHCLDTFGSRSRWIAFHDIDEFLFTPSDALVTPTLRRLEHLPGIAVRTFLFGTSGHYEVPDSVLHSLVMRSAEYGLHKSIVDPRRVRFVRNPHRFSYYGEAQAAEPDTEELRINHYFARSLRGLEQKAARGCVWNGLDRRDLDAFRDLDRTLNAVEDRAIQPLAAALGLIGADV